MHVYDTASELYNEMLVSYFTKYEKFSNDPKYDPKYDLTNLMLNAYDSKRWFTEKHVNDSKLKGDRKEALDDVPRLERL